MHDLSFAESVCFRPVKILSLPMLPYSIGHEILLLSQCNAILFSPEHFNKLSGDEQRAAIIRATSICSRTWNQNKKPESNLVFWLWWIRKSNWPVEIAEFRNYRASCSGPPQPSKEDYEIANGLQNEESGREFGGSHLARLLNFCATIYRQFDFETVYDFPMGMANHFYLAELEMAGNCKIENAREAQVKQEMAEHRAAIAKEKHARA